MALRHDDASLECSVLVVTKNIISLFRFWPCVQGSASSSVDNLAPRATTTTAKHTEAASKGVPGISPGRAAKSDDSEDFGDGHGLDSNESEIDDTELSDSAGDLPSNRIGRGTVLATTRRRRTPAAVVYGDAGLDSLSDSDHSDSDERSQPRRGSLHATNK